MSNISATQAPRFNRERTPAFKTERANERRPFKPKRWSHQTELDGLKGKEIHILFKDADAWVPAVLIDADQFALKVEMVVAVAGKQGEATKSTLTYFKSDIAAYAAA